MSIWIPAEERGKIGGLVFACNVMGVVMGNMLSGLSIYYFENWPIPFYVWGGCGIALVLATMMWINSNPESTKHITDNERTTIRVSIGWVPISKIPVRKILSDRGTWAIALGCFGHTYIQFTLINDLPKYMNNVLHYNMLHNSFASSIPYLIMYVMAVGFGVLSDSLVKKEKCSKGCIRRIYAAISK